MAFANKYITCYNVLNILHTVCFMHELSILELVYIYIYMSSHSVFHNIIWGFTLNAFDNVSEQYWY